MNDDDPKKLFWAVIMQAFHDADPKSPNNRDVTPEDTRRARAWLTQRSQDFRDVCALAGIDDGVVYRAARRRLNVLSWWNVCESA